MRTPHGATAPRRGPGLFSAFPAAAALAVAACADDPGDAATTEFEQPNADEVLYGVSHTMTNNGVREALLTADSMFSWRDSANTWVVGLKLEVFDEGTGLPQATITSDRGRLDMALNELKAIGNAFLEIPGQEREIRSDELHVSPDSDRIWSELPVVMREAGCEIEGDRFDSDMSFDQVKLWGTRERECPNR